MWHTTNHSFQMKGKNIINRNGEWRRDKRKTEQQQKVWRKMNGNVKSTYLFCMDPYRCHRTLWNQILNSLIHRCWIFDMKSFHSNCNRRPIDLCAPTKITQTLNKMVGAVSGTIVTKSYAFFGYRFVLF